MLAFVFVLLLLVVGGYFLAGTGNSGCSSNFFCPPDFSLVLLGILVTAIFVAAGLLRGVTGGGRTSEPPPND